MHREEELDLSRVVTFNLDEYYGLHGDRLQSYHRRQPTIHQALPSSPRSMFSTTRTLSYRCLALIT